MKRIFFSRKSILRAIRAAALAVYFALAAVAHAQTAMGDGNGNVTISGTGNMPFSLGPISSPPLASGGTLTISSGANLNVGGSSSTVSAYAVQVGIPATITNSGSLSAYNSNNFSGGPAVALDITPLTTGGNLTILNNSAGTITASTYMGTATAIDVENVQNGSVSITNSGYITTAPHPYFAAPGQGNNFTDVFVSDTSASGSISLTNTGMITTTGSTAVAYGANLSTDGSGGISVTNSGTISVDATEEEGNISAGLYLTSSGSGNIMVNNSGLVSGSGYVNSLAVGIDATASGSGAISITNTGTVSGYNTENGASGLGIDVTASGSGGVTINNSGPVTASASGAATGISVTSVANASVTNSAYIQGTSSGGGSSGIAVTTTGGTASLLNSGNVTLNASGGVTGLATNTGTNNATISNSGSIQLTGGAGTGAAIVANNTGTSTAMMTNTGNLSVTTQSNVYGITGVNNAQNASYSITNSGAINLVTNNASSGLIRAQGLTAYAGGSQSVINHGDITISGTSSNVYADGILCSGGTATVTNSGTLNTTASSYANGILADSGNADATVENSGAMTVIGTASGAYATGIFILGGGQVSNSGNLVVSANAGATGIGIRSFGADATITNSASVSAVSPAGSASALYINAVTGDANVNNSGRVTGTSGSATYVGAGISTQAAAGPTTITNSGYAGGFNTGGGTGYGISVDPAGPIIVTNTGTAIGTTAGIFLTNAGTVNNYGLASGGTYSIQVPTGSTVNLDGASPVKGLLKGGVDDTSTSQLNFNLVVRGNHLAADEAALNAAIAQYDAAYTAANGNGANVDSEVVTINGVAYQWEDFLGIADNLIQGRLYESTPGFYSEGLALDNLDPSNAKASTILNALGNVPDAGLVKALSELSPQELEVFSNVATNVATFNTAKINNHLANRRDGLTGFDATALNVQDSSMDPSLNQVRDHLLAYSPVATPGLMSDTVDSILGGVDMRDLQVNTTPTDRWSSFIAGDVVLADLSHNANIEDANYTTGNVTAGADYRLDDHFTMGALFAYSHTDANLDSRGSSATVDSYSPGIYASYVDKGWYGNFLGAYGRNAYTSDRMVDIPGLAGDNHGGTSGNQGTVNLTGGYEFQKGSFKFGPVASAQYVHLSVDSMQEQGPTALSINSQDEDSFRSQFGVEGRFVADLNTLIGPISLTPHVSASWQHEYLDSSRGINAQFTGTGGGSFVTQTDNPDRDAAFIDVGLDATVSKNVTVFVDYETQVGQQNYFAQSAEGGVKIGF